MIRLETQEKLRQWWDNKNAIDGIFGHVEDVIFPIVRQLQEYSVKKRDKIDLEYDMPFDLQSLNPHNFSPDYPSELSLRNSYIDERMYNFLQDNK